MSDISDVTTALALIHQVLKSEPAPCLRHDECRKTANLLTGAYLRLSELASRGIVRTGTGSEPATQLRLQRDSKRWGSILNPDKPIPTNSHNPDQHSDSNHPGEVTEGEWAVALGESRPESPAAHSKNRGSIGVRHYVNQQMD